MPRISRKQDGLATVEAAVTAPLLILMLLVVVDFGRVMYSAITTTGASHTAVSYGAQATLFALDHAGMNQAARADAVNLPINSSNSAHVGSTARHFCRCPGSSSEVSCTSNTCGVAPAVFVEVGTIRTFETVANYPVIPTDVNLQRTAIMRVQ